MPPTSFQSPLSNLYFEPNCSGVTICPGAFSPTNYPHEERELGLDCSGGDTCLEMSLPSGTPLPGTRLSLREHDPAWRLTAAPSSDLQAALCQIWPLQASPFLIIHLKCRHTLGTAGVEMTDTHKCTLQGVIFVNLGVARSAWLTTTLYSSVTPGEVQAPVLCQQRSVSSLTSSLLLSLLTGQALTLTLMSVSPVMT